MAKRLWSSGGVRTFVLAGCVVVNVVALAVASMLVSGAVDQLSTTGDTSDSVGSLVPAAVALLAAAATSAALGPLFAPVLRRYIDSQVDETLRLIDDRDASGRGRGIGEEADLLTQLLGFTHRESVAALVDWLKQRARGLTGLVMLFVIAPLVGVLSALAFSFYGVQFTRLLARILESLDSSAGYLRRRAEYIRGLLLNTSHAGEWRVLGSVQWLQDLYSEKSKQAVYDAASTREKGLGRVPAASLLTFAVVAIGASLLGLETWRGDMSIGALTVGLLGLVFIMDLGPIGDTAVLVRQAAKTEAELSRLASQLPQAQSDEVNGAGAAAQASSEPVSPVVLEVRDLEFRYGSSDGFNLRIDSFHLHMGESVAIVGPNGSGKTTFLGLLHGELQPASGEVLLDSSATVSLVPQEAARYPVSLRENVTLGDTTARADSGLELARLTSLSRELTDEVLGESGEAGRDLSGGQWQRVSVARGFARDSDLLILDEPSAALDMEAEAAIFAALTGVQEHAAVLVTTHHLANARLVDRIVVLEDGCVVESGSHAELMRCGGRYADMFRAQAAGLGVTL